VREHLPHTDFLGGGWRAIGGDWVGAHRAFTVQEYPLSRTLRRPRRVRSRKRRALAVVQRLR
jgi:hypothetical protein